MNRYFQDFVVEQTGAEGITGLEVIQQLWSGYGEIVRVHLSQARVASVVVKYITLPLHQKHPRGWSGEFAHRRKLKSYDVETHWYRDWSHLCDAHCRVAKCYAATGEGDERILLLEDLDHSGYPKRYEYLGMEGVKRCLCWLAWFHASFMGVTPSGLWENGTYWHLQTRPDEWASMDDDELKRRAGDIDQLLNGAQFHTLVHGDAKVANFCFSDNEAVAAVDFQYVGGGCGIKDVAYFLGSCLNDRDCFAHESQALDYYFAQLRKALYAKGSALDVDALESEWRGLYPVAIADFYRFLVGWAPTHKKINSYSEAHANRVLQTLFNGV